MEQKLHTPEGVRDIYNKECETKLALQRKLSKVLHLYGYQDIQTPTFEYYEVFRKEIGSTSTQELYKFFDREGNILALRPDITPSVARAAATLFESEDMPIRLCYAGNTFINHSSYQGRLKENTQLGAELIGLDSVEADAEMLAMVADSLKQIGLQEFQISLGHVDFIRSLLKAAGLGEEESREIRALITNRNFFGIEEILDEHEVKERLLFREKRYQNKEILDWGLVVKETNTLIGTITVVEYDENIGTMEIGYAIGRPWWHKGYTSEAFAAIIPFFFNEVKVGRIESQHDPNNPNSGKVMQKCGLKYEGTLRKADWSNKGIVDACIYGLLAEDYFNA